MTDLSPSHQRGAPPGNTNALKHGFYSRAFQQLEQSDLADLDPASLEHEIQLLRVFIRRVAQQGEQAANLPESMALLAVLSRAAISLASLLRTHRAITAAVQHREFQDLITQANHEIEHANSLVERLSHRLADLDLDLDSDSEEEEPTTSPAGCPKSPAPQDCPERPPAPYPASAAPALPAQETEPRDSHPPVQGPTRSPSVPGLAGFASLPPSARTEQMLLGMLAQVRSTQPKPPAAGQAGSATLPPSARIEQMLLGMLAQVRSTQPKPPAAGQAGSATLPPSARIEQMLLGMIDQVKSAQANPPAALAAPPSLPSGNPLPGP